MKPLVLDSSSIFLCLKNEQKIFPFKEIHEKGGPTLRWAISEPPTLFQCANEEPWIVSFILSRKKWILIGDVSLPNVGNTGTKKEI